MTTIDDFKEILGLNDTISDLKIVSKMEKNYISKNIDIVIELLERFKNGDNSIDNIMKVIKISNEITDDILTNGNTTQKEKAIEIMSVVYCYYFKMLNKDREYDN